MGGGKGFDKFPPFIIQIIAINNQNVSFLHNLHIFLFLETRGSVDYVTTKEGGLNFFVFWLCMYEEKLPITVVMLHNSKNFSRF